MINVGVIDIKTGVRVRNKFEIEVKDVKTGKVVQKAFAHNAILDAGFSRIVSTSAQTNWSRYVHFGSGTGTLELDRTSLFTFVGAKDGGFSESMHEKVWDVPPEPIYFTRKVVILPAEHVGVTFTEVGVGASTSSSSLSTHAFIEDSEGNPISIGPKTDTQEITIYATVYLEFDPSNNIQLTKLNEAQLYFNYIVAALLTGEFNRLNETSTSTISNGIGFRMNNIKGATDPATNYSTTGAFGSQIGVAFTISDAANKQRKTPRIRFEAGSGTGKCWGITCNQGSSTSTSSRGSCFRMEFPNAYYTGHQFQGKAIGTGDGTTTIFELPWDDINEGKAKTWYVDGVETPATIIENTTSSTKIEFASAPANEAPITGDWWVDYVPKDAEHILDITFTINVSDGNVA